MPPQDDRVALPKREVTRDNREMGVSPAAHSQGRERSGTLTRLVAVTLLLLGCGGADLDAIRRRYSECVQIVELGGRRYRVHSCGTDTSPERPHTCFVCEDPRLGGPPLCHRLLPTQVDHHLYAPPVCTKEQD